jgi:hypothetical protein
MFSSVAMFQFNACHSPFCTIFNSMWTIQVAHDFVKSRIIHLWIRRDKKEVRHDSSKPYYKTTHSMNSTKHRSVWLFKAGYAFCIGYIYVKYRLVVSWVMGPPRELRFLPPFIRLVRINLKDLPLLVGIAYNGMGPREVHACMCTCHPGSFFLFKRTKERVRIQVISKIKKSSPSNPTTPLHPIQIHIQLKHGIAEIMFVNLLVY